jgi:hypothetical protein
VKGQEILSPIETWETLTESQQIVCASLAKLDWQSGLSREAILAVSVKIEVVEELVKRDIVEARPGWEYAQEFVDQYRDHVAKLESRFIDPSTKLTEEEQLFLSLYRNRQTVAEERDEEIRYRLSDKKFFDYLHEQIGIKL